MCRDCTLFFRYPYIAEEKLIEIYQEIDTDGWHYESGRRDFQLAADTIKATFSGGKILDVGCFRGDFLNILPDNFIKFGVELSTSAQKIARDNNITFIGSSIDKIENNRTKYNIITLFDVIEHLPHPMDTLRKITELLLPGGIILVSTGNTDSLLWRLMRLDYWYYCSEHVSFFSPRWFRWASGQLNFKIDKLISFSHFNDPLLQKLYQLAQFLSYRIWKTARQHTCLKRNLAQVYPFNKVSQWQAAPVTMFWKDHMLIVLKFPA